MSAEMSRPHPEAPPLNRGLLSFLRAELEGALGAFLRPFLGVTAAATLLLGLYLMVNASSTTPDAEADQTPFLLRLLVVAVFSLYYALPLGIIAGGVRLLWRLCGVWFLFPLITIPLLVGLTWYLFSGWLGGEAAAVLEALGTSIQVHGFQHVGAMLGGMRVAHAGAAGLVVLVFLLPFMVPGLFADLFTILIDPGFLFQFLYFLACFGLVTLIGLLPAGFVSTLVLGLAFGRRLLARYRRFMAGSGAG